MSQFSLFGAAAAEPSLDDLGGVLLAGGHWVSRGGDSRLSVVVADRWRADALTAEFAALGIADAEDVPRSSGGGFGVRTAFGPRLAGPAARWSRGAGQAPPAGFELTAGGLRLWTVAAGRRDPAGFLLPTPDPDGALHRVAGAALARLGLAAVSVPHRRGPGWRVTSAKRIRRLAELVGPAPAGGAADWPDVS